MRCEQSIAFGLILLMLSGAMVGCLWDRERSDQATAERVCNLLRDRKPDEALVAASRLRQPNRFCADAATVPLIEAVERNATDVVERLLEQGAMPDFQPYAHDPARRVRLLLGAIFNERDRRIVELLLNAGADINARYDGIYAAEEMQPANSDREQRRFDRVYAGMTPLFLAGLNADAELFRKLLARGADCSFRYENRILCGGDILHLAAANIPLTGDDVTRMLTLGARLECVADAPWEKDHFGFTPLCMSVIGTHPENAGILVRAGANKAVCIRNKTFHGATVPMLYLCLNEAPSIQGINALSASGFDFTIKDDNGRDLVWYVRQPQLRTRLPKTDYESLVRRCEELVSMNNTTAR